MHHKIKVVFGLPSFVVGGTERQLLKQLKVYDYSTFDVSLITFFEHTDKKTLYDQLPPQVHVTRLAFKSNTDWSAWKRLLSILRTIRPDVVVSSAFRPNTIFRLLKPFFGYVAITREHNTYIEKNLIQKMIDHVLSYLSYRIIAISTTVAMFASRQAFIPYSKFLVILNGVDTDEINAFNQESQSIVHMIRSELGILSTQKIILNVGRLKPQKNQILLIDGFMRFYANHPEYVLVILGEGIDRAKLEEHIRYYDNPPSIKLMGHREDVYAFLAASDVFVLTSRHEGGPNAVLEALAFGLPVISTPIAGVNEYMHEGDNGFFIEPTTESLTTKLELVADLSDNQRATLKKRARETAEEFAVEKVAGIYMDLIKHAIHSSR